jgi:hypothetical protein
MVRSKLGDEGPADGTDDDEPDEITIGALEPLTSGEPVAISSTLGGDIVDMWVSTHITTAVTAIDATTGRNAPA